MKQSKPFNLGLDLKLKQQLQDAAEKDGRSLAGYIRQTLREQLQREKAGLNKQL